MLGKSAAVSAQASRAGGDGGAADVGDALAALRDEVLGGERSQFVVFHADVIGVGAGQHAVDQNVRRLIGLEHLEQFEPSFALRGGDDQAVDFAVDQHIHLAPFHVAVFLGVGNDHLIAERMEFAGDALGDFSEEGVHQVGQHQSHHIGAAGNHAARDPVGLIIQLAHPLEHAVARFFADVAVVAKSLRNRHQRHAEVVGDILHANGQ